MSSKQRRALLALQGTEKPAGDAGLPSMPPLDQPRPHHGMQAMMLRWEALHPVNAIQAAQLRRPVSAEEVCAAAERVLRKIVATREPEHSPLVFERHSIGENRRAGVAEIVTSELNRRYAADEPPFRVLLIESSDGGQLLALAYRHVVADARSITLTLHEIIHELYWPGASPAEVVRPVGESMSDFFPEEFRWQRLPGLALNSAAEVMRSLRTFRLPSSDPADLRMQFRLHDHRLKLTDVKRVCRERDATVNDVIFAALLEWLAGKYPLAQRGWRKNLSIATLVDLNSRAERPIAGAFGQFLSQFAVRVPVTANMPFSEIIRLVQQGTTKQKTTRTLIHCARGFQVMAALWDFLPLLRWPASVPLLIPLSAGISNVNVDAILNDSPVLDEIVGYYRGTCVTNILPMMFCITTAGGVCSFTTTHRPTVFEAGEIDDAVHHVAGRLSEPG